MIRGAERRYSDKVNPGDGVNEEEDCNDEDALVYPGAEEVPFKKMEYQAQQGMVPTVRGLLSSQASLLFFSSM